MKNKTKKVLALCIALVAVFAIAGTAYAGQVGSWKFYTGQSKQRLTAGEVFTGVTTRERTAKSKFVINVRTADNGYIIREGTAGVAHLKFRVLDSNSAIASDWLDVYHNNRSLGAYNSAYADKLGNYYLRIWNYNGFNVVTCGTWCPDNG